MKQRQPRQRPQQTPANTARHPRPGGYRRRGPKSPVERSWRKAFEGIHAVEALPGRRSKGTPAPASGSPSGAMKRRARGRRPRVLREP